MTSMRDALVAALKTKQVASEGSLGKQLAPSRESQLASTNKEIAKRNGSAPKTSLENISKLSSYGFPIQSKNFATPLTSVSLPAAIAAAKTPERVIALSQGASFKLRGVQNLPIDLLTDTEAPGLLEQCHGVVVQDEREVALGFDFGTSCTKVVIGDAALGKSFAVPFCSAPGLSAYLLPSRIYQTGDTFSISKGEVAHRDLKLSLLAQPENRDLQVRVVAFLALAIRRSRGWLFTRQKSAYRHTRIVWKIAVGLPAASGFESDLAKHLKSLTVAAWALAVVDAALTVSSIEAALDRAMSESTANRSAEVSIVPELSAQIYGFVASNAFDKRASNKFLMVDVGAGTVDSSLFHVKPAKGNRWDFEFYTAVVEPHGVANLHRYRVNWWLESLKNVNAPSVLLDELRESQFATDALAELPVSFTDYFDGVDVRFLPNRLTPDAEFFDGKVLAQVRGKTLWRTWKDGLLEKGALSGIPFFLCGGGARSAYYSALEASLAPSPGFRWLEAEPWVMAAPIDLQAEGLEGADFDRISVAYGLSRLEVGKVVKALPPPKVQVQPVMTWRDNYVDKDQC